MSEQDLFDKIEAYLLGELSPEAARTFEEQIDKDPELAAAVELQRFEHEAMEVLVETDLRKKMAQWSATEPEPPSGPSAGKKRRLPPWWYGLIALVVLSAFFGIRPLLNSSSGAGETDTSREIDENSPDMPPAATPEPDRRSEPAPTATPDDPEKTPPVAGTPPSSTTLPDNPRTQAQLIAIAAPLLDDPYVNASQTRSLTDSEKLEEDPLTKAGLSYLTRNYNILLELKDSYKPDDPEFADFQELLGLAYFRLERFDEAAATFRQLAQNDEIYFDDEGTRQELRRRAEWRLLLSLFAQGDLEAQEFIALRQKIIDAGHPRYSGRASDLK